VRLRYHVKDILEINLGVLLNSPPLIY
jgi:hypothetical protein